MAIFTLVLILAGPPRVTFHQQGTADFAAITTADATRLAGRWVRLRVELDSLPEAREGAVVYDCASTDSAQRTVWFEQGETGGDDADVKPGDGGQIEVVGRLVLVDHRGRRIGVTNFAGFTEFRLMDARLVR